MKYSTFSADPKYAGAFVKSTDVKEGMSQGKDENGSSIPPNSQPSGSQTQRHGGCFPPGIAGNQTGTNFSSGNNFKMGEVILTILNEKSYQTDKNNNLYCTNLMEQENCNKSLPITVKMVLLKKSSQI